MTYLWNSKNRKILTKVTFFFKSTLDLLAIASSLYSCFFLQSFCIINYAILRKRKMLTTYLMKIFLAYLVASKYMPRLISSLVG